MHKSMSCKISALAKTYGIKNLSLLKTQGYANGKWISSDTDFQVVNPATDEPLISVSDIPIKQIEESIPLAEKAFGSFSKTTARERAQMLRKYYELMMENAEDLAKICTLENGKPLADSLGEVKYAASFFEWFSEEAPRLYGDVIPSANGNNRIITIRQPVGVVGILTPWNFPYAMIARKVGAAIASGCTCVIKPACETPLSALALTELSIQAGIPPGVINIFPVSQEPTKIVGQMFSEHPLIRKLSFTGSTPVGKILMAQSSSTLKKLSFELGGNAPFIVFDDADVDRAVAGALACKLRQSGQTCVCANRLYVQSGVYEEFIEKLSSKVSAMRLGNGMDENSTHGPLIHSRAVAKVEEHVTDALSKGAKVVVGGKRRLDLGPNFHDLTILRDVPLNAKVCHDETFGPLAPVIKFETEDEVLKLANDSDVGLAGYFFSKDYARIFRVGEALEVGMVGANTGGISEAALPFGGVKSSGFGREGSKYGLDDYTVVKSIVIGM